ncbi:hypothetical protein BS47DRAFT_1369846 [Hydnum rufescens UP504]|uniref:Uncharacterized protein n=1 Tax=Hydnum rufescens UP504 TaxID=1448309 RepID=A0A9P6ACD4_9AGAM|nr:hypothetical protein BS47DRAFT_1369846 [Hydnum rufescens UP504]
MPPKARKTYKRNKWVTVPTASPAFSKGKMAESSTARPSTKPRATGPSDAPMKSVVGDLVQQCTIVIGGPPPPNPIHGGYFDFCTRTHTPTQDHRDDTPLFLDDGEGSEDEIDHGLENGGDIDSGDEVLAKSLGGPFTEQQIAEIREIVDAMNQQLEQKAKEWEQPLESVMRIGNLGINTRERQSGGNLWNAFHHSYEKDSDPDRPHHEYVEKVIQPAYRSLILEHGGEDSAEWKKKVKELWKHTCFKAAQAAAIALSPATMAVAGDDSFSILVYQGEQRLQRDVGRKVPKTMHMMRKEISEELQNLLKPLLATSLGCHGQLYPDSLQQSSEDGELGHRVGLSESNLEETVRAFFEPKDDSQRVRILQLADDTRLPDDTAIVVDRYNAILVTTGQAYESEGSGGPESHNGVNGSNSVATGSSRSRKRRSDTSGGPVQKKKRVHGGRKKGARDVISSKFIAESDEEPEEQGASTFDASLGGISGSASGPDPFAVPVNWENGLNTGVYNPVVPNDVPPSDFDALLAQYPDLALD